MPFHCKILIDFVDNTGLTIQSDLVRFRHIFNVCISSNRKPSNRNCEYTGQEL